jgi:hypothetical protein
MLLCEQLTRNFKKVLEAPGGYLLELKKTAGESDAGKEQVP